MLWRLVVRVKGEELLRRHRWLSLWPWKMSSSQMKRSGGRSWGDPSFSRWEVRLRPGKVERGSLGALGHSLTIPRMTDGGPTPYSSSPGLWADPASRRHRPLALSDQGGISPLMHTSHDCVNACHPSAVGLAVQEELCPSAGLPLPCLGVNQTQPSPFVLGGFHWVPFTAFFHLGG